MNKGRTILSQVLDFISKYEFDKCVAKYNGNYRVRSFTCWEQFIVMMFAQFTYRESLRDIESCLAAISGKLYHSGVKSKVKRSTLSDANEKRDWRIYAEIAQLLIGEARELYKEDHNFSVNIDEIAYALDSSTIDLCLSLFPWAKFRKNKAAVKMHTQLDLRGNIPTFIEITDGKVHDVNILDALTLEPGAFYIMDRAYLDFERLYHLNECLSFFVIREKRNFNYRRVYSNKVDKTLGFKCDQIIKLTGFYSKQKYPEKLRRIKYFDKETGKTLVFLTNNFTYQATIIAELYKERWKIELFFKWIKQHLRIKSFFGTSLNAVYTQIWIAVSAYLIIAIMKKRLKIELELYTILQILSISLFEKVTVNQLLNNKEYRNNINDDYNQLEMFDL
ncbi:IS4 family transposase [Salegentibacter sp. LM13S]|uniref:IS4 family transposase n=1 Tax=Salegentibacter lacus TaxID=2873599 RepID=UPI001CCF078C|nr:IS4 family transposase [Salegentibacter lacus]MBZ9631548.1 IS4 family transposase [Salegentibacter lacus]